MTVPLSRATADHHPDSSFRSEAPGKAVAGSVPVKRNRFITLAGGHVSVNRELQAKARALAGLKGYTRKASHVQARPEGPPGLPSVGNRRPADCHECPRLAHKAFKNGCGGLVQKMAKQLPDASSTRRCRGVAAEYFNDDWGRAPASLLNVIGADASTRPMPRTSMLAPHRPPPRCLRLAPPSAPPTRHRAATSRVHHLERTSMRRRPRREAASRLGAPSRRSPGQRFYLGEVRHEQPASGFPGDRPAD